MAKKKITFDILNQTGTLRTVQTAFVAQARQEGWEPWEIAEVISASMSGKTLIPMAEYNRPCAMRGSSLRRCSSVPYVISPGATWRSAIQCAATGAPRASSSSVTT